MSGVPAGSVRVTSTSGRHARPQPSRPVRLAGPVGIAHGHPFHGNEGPTTAVSRSLKDSPGTTSGGTDAPPRGRGIPGGSGPGGGPFPPQRGRPEVRQACLIARRAGTLAPGSARSNRPSASSVSRAISAPPGTLPQVVSTPSRISRRRLAPEHLERLDPGSRSRRRDRNSRIPASGASTGSGRRERQTRRRSPDRCHPPHLDGAGAVSAAAPAAGPEAVPEDPPRLPGTQLRELLRERLRVAGQLEGLERQDRGRRVVAVARSAGGKRVITTSGRNVRITRTTSESTCWWSHFARVCR